MTNLTQSYRCLECGNLYSVGYTLCPTCGSNDRHLVSVPLPNYVIQPEESTEPMYDVTVTLTVSRLEESTVRELTLSENVEDTDGLRQFIELAAHTLFEDYVAENEPKIPK